MATTGVSYNLVLYREVEKLYQQKRFLEAWAKIEPFFDNHFDLSHLSCADIILLSRLMSRLGAFTHCRLLRRYARRNFPDDAEMLFYAEPDKHQSLFESLKYYEETPPPKTASSEIASSWLAAHAMTWASLRNFKKADEILIKAFAQKPAATEWLDICHSYCLMEAERWHDALKVLKRIVAVNRVNPWAIQLYCRALQNLNRDDQCLSFLKQLISKSQSYHVHYQYINCLNAIIERCADSEEQKRLAQITFETISAMRCYLPLGDRSFRRALTRLRLDTAFCINDREKLLQYSGRDSSSFYRRIAENIQGNPQAEKMMVPYKKVRQKHNTCFPSSVATALAAFGVDVDEDALADELTYGGTPTQLMVDWLKCQGYGMCHFFYNRQRVEQVLEKGIPIILLTSGDNSGHASVIVGCDRAAGTLIVHDPSFNRLSFILEQHLADDEKPLGPHLLAVFPQERQTEMNFFPKEEEELLLAWEKYFSLVQTTGRDDAKVLVENIIARYPEHPLAVYLESLLLARCGESGLALNRLKGLIEKYPECVQIRRTLISICRSKNDTAYLRSVLAEVVKEKRFTGVSSLKDWTSAPACYMSQYADLLMHSQETAGEARCWTMQALRNSPYEADAYSSLGDLLALQNNRSASLLPYEAAAFLEYSNCYHARIFADALNEEGSFVKAESFLYDRMQFFIKRTRGVQAALTYISFLEKNNLSEKALEVLRQIGDSFSSNEDYLFFKVKFCVRHQLWDEASAALEKLDQGHNRLLYCEAAVYYCGKRGENSRAFKMAQDWLTSNPLSYEARSSYLYYQTQLEGNSRSLATARQWYESDPHNEDLQELYLEEMSNHFDRQGRLEVLRRRVERNSTDAWAWREIVYALVNLCEHKGEILPAYQEEMKLALEKSLHLDSHSESSYLAQASVYELQGDWMSALTAFKCAFRMSPSDISTMNKIWSLVSCYDGANRQSTAAFLEEQVLSKEGPKTSSYALTVNMLQIQNYDEVSRKVQGWVERSPTDAQLHLCLARLHLYYGNGLEGVRQASTILEEARMRFPFCTDTSFYLACAYDKLLEFDKAAEMHKRVLELNPTEVHSRCSLAQYYQRQGRNDEAWQCLSGDLAKFPRHAGLYKACLDYLKENRKRDDIDAFIYERLKDFGNNIELAETTIDFYKEQEDFPAALAVAEKLLTFYPEGAYCLFLKASVMGDGRLYESWHEIETLYQRAIELNGDLWAAVYSLSSVYMENYDIPRAEAVLKHHLEMATDREYPLLHLCRCRFLKGETHEAVEDLRSLLRDYPRFEQAWRYLFDCLTELKDKDIVQELLSDEPASLLDYPDLRGRRLELLRHAGTELKQLASTWDDLVALFPGDNYINLEYFDQFWQAGYRDKAAAVLRAYANVVPSTQYIEARMCQVHFHEADDNQAFALINKLITHEQADGSWPAYNCLKTLVEFDRVTVFLRKFEKSLDEGSVFCETFISALLYYQDARLSEKLRLNRRLILKLSTFIRKCSFIDAERNLAEYLIDHGKEKLFLQAFAWPDVDNNNSPELWAQIIRGYNAFKSRQLLISFHDFPKFPGRCPFFALANYMGFWQGKSFFLSKNRSERQLFGHFMMPAAIRRHLMSVIEWFLVHGESDTTSQFILCRYGQMLIQENDRQDFAKFWQAFGNTILAEGDYYHIEESRIVRDVFVRYSHWQEVDPQRADDRLWSTLS